MGGKSYLKSDLREKYRISGGGFIDSEELKGCFVAKLHLSQFMCFFSHSTKSSDTDENFKP